VGLEDLLVACAGFVISRRQRSRMSGVVAFDGIVNQAGFIPVSQ